MITDLFRISEMVIRKGHPRIPILHQQEHISGVERMGLPPSYDGNFETEYHLEDQLAFPSMLSGTLKISTAMMPLQSRKI